MHQKLIEGERLFAAGNIEDAEECFLAVTRSDPTSIEAYNNLGVISFHRKNQEMAANYFLKAISLDASRTDAIANLCALLQGSDNLHEALPLLESLVDKYPDNKELTELHERVTESGKKTVIRSRTKLAVICLPGLESFLGEIVNHVKANHEVRTCYSANKQELEATLGWADTVWLEWANELTVALTNQSNLLDNKRVICRLHSYEALAGFAKQINWEKVSDLVFVAQHIKELVKQQVPNLLERVREVHVIPNGVDLEKFALKVRKRGHNIAYLGQVNYKKGPMLLLHAFRELVQSDSNYVLHIGGTFQDARYELYYSQMIREMSLEDNIKLHGWVDDVAGWLEDKEYVVCSSVLEGHPVGLMEGMACGLKPLIHNFVGARELYPSEFIWNTIPEFVGLVRQQDYDSNKYREFIATKFSLEKQLGSIDTLLGSGVTGPVKTKIESTATSEQNTAVSQPIQTEKERTVTPQDVSDAMFSNDPATRINAVKQEAVNQSQEGRHDLSETSLLRLALMTKFADQSVIDNLVRLYQSREEIPAIQSVWKRAAATALEENRLDEFLTYVYVSIYAENGFSRNPNYQYAIVDHDLNTYTRLAANSHPLRKWVGSNRKAPGICQANGKLRIGFVLEGFSQTQAPTRNYYPLAEHYDREKYELYFYSRWFMGEKIAESERYAETTAFLQKNQCQVRTPEQRMNSIEQVEFLTRQIVSDEIDILVFQTTYFVPPYNFISCLHPAPFQAALEHQQPEYSHELDLVFTTRKQIIECNSQTAPWPILSTRKPIVDPADRSTLGIPESATILISVNRDARYRQEEFWTQMQQVLKKHPQVYFVAVGLSNLRDLLPAESSVRKQVIAPGFRSDIMELLAMADIYVDLFPSGGGSSIIEAMQAGLPVLCFDQDFSSLYTVRDVSLAPTFVDDTELVVPYGDVTGWQEMMDRLLTNENLRKKIGRNMAEAATKFEPKRVTAEFFENLESAFRQKQKTDAE